MLSLFFYFLGIGDWDWGLGIGDWGLGPIPIIINEFNKKI